MTHNSINPLAHGRLLLQLARRPSLAAALAVTRARGRPVLVFYCQLAAHRQTAHEVIRVLTERREQRFALVVLNTFDRAGQLPWLQLPKVREFVSVPPSFVRLWRPAAIITPMVGFRRRHAPLDVPVVHLMITLASLDGMFDEAQFDGYDYVACAGTHQIDAFREWRARGPRLAGKTLLPAGYPKLDWQLREAAGGPPDESTVVYAPTHIYAVTEALASLRRHGREIVRALLAAGWRVIFRPHPESLRDQDAALVAKIVTEHQGNDRFKLDRAASYAASYSASSLIVTDISGTGFTYAFTFGRPAVFFAANAVAEANMKGVQFEAREQIGGVVRTIPDLIQVVRALSEGRAAVRQRIESFRAQTIFNLGSSADYIVDRMEKIVHREHCADWVQL
jgi:hypothetical protein